MNKMRKTKERTLLEGLYKAVINYFDVENAFRSNPTDKTWDARLTADSKLTTALSKVECFLHPDEEE